MPCLRGWYGAALLFLAALLIAPIWAFANPPLVDYPNHLARGYILYHYAEVPGFHEHFEIDYLSTPSLAMDLFMVGLQPICNVRLVGKLFLTLTLVLWLAGWHLLGRAIHGRPTWLALGAALVAYHSMFFYGFTNFSFGLGVFLIALAAWYHGRSHWPWPRHLLVAALALACYFSHMSAFIFLAGSVLAVTAWECARARKISVATIIEVLPAFVPVVFFFRGGGQSGLSWNFPAKLVGALSLLRGYHRYTDAAFMAAVAVFLLFLFLWSVRIRAVGSVLFTGLGCVAMFLIGPNTLFGGSPADARFLPAAAALIFLSLDLSFPRGKAIVLLVTFLMLVTVRMGMICYSWHEIDADMSEQIALIAEFPDQARVYPIVKISEQSDDRKRQLPSFHAVCYAVIDRRVHLPTLLAFAGHNPLRYKGPRVMDHVDPDPFKAVDKVHWDEVFTHYDYVWCYRVPDDYRRFLEGRCTLVAERGAGTVWRVRGNGIK